MFCDVSDRVPNYKPDGFFFHINSNEYYFFSRVAHITNTSLTNIKGEKKSVIHLADDMEPIYQYIPHAYCV